MNNFLSDYIDLTFLKKFLILLIVIHAFNTFNLAITVPKGAVYSSFLDDNLNYIAWIRSYILHTSNVIAHLAGVNTYVDITKLKVFNGSGVIMDSACIGLGLMAFWIAFVVAQPGNARRKLAWCITGTLSICFINSVRVVLLLIAANNHWKFNRFADHHTMYNIASYLVIAILIYIFFKNNSTDEVVSRATI